MRGMTKKGILLQADPPYKVTNDGGEVTAEGMKAIWIPDETLEHYEKDVKGRVILGLKPYPITLTAKCYEKLKSVPGMYNFNMEYTDVTETKEYNGVKTKTIVQGVTATAILEYVGEIEVKVKSTKG